MATKAYDIPTLLEGKYYRSLGRNIEGIIQYAEKRDAIWYGENFEAYAIQVRPTYSQGSFSHSDFWATVAVRISE